MTCRAYRLRKAQLQGEKAQLAKENDDDLQALLDRVCGKAGTTTDQQTSEEKRE